jgi:hypothetical protein
VLDFGYPQNCALEVLQSYINFGNVRVRVGCCKVFVVVHGWTTLRPFRLMPPALNNDHLHHWRPRLVRFCMALFTYLVFSGCHVVISVRGLVLPLQAP